MMRQGKHVREYVYIEMVELNRLSFIMIWNRLFGSSKTALSTHTYIKSSALVRREGNAVEDMIGYLENCDENNVERYALNVFGRAKRKGEDNVKTLHDALIRMKQFGPDHDVTKRVEEWIEKKGKHDEI